MLEKRNSNRRTETLLLLNYHFAIMLMFFYYIKVQLENILITFQLTPNHIDIK